MLTLYYRPTCAFCRRVLAVVDRLAIKVELKDISEEAIIVELEAKADSLKVPYLVDEKNSLAMYESDAIVDYLQKNYGRTSNTPTRPRVHIADNVCISCEG